MLFSFLDMAMEGATKLGARTAVMKKGKEIIVVVSRDPNDKAGPAGFGERKCVSSNYPLGYIIYFENDPEKATAPAEEVVITDQLSTNLDWSTFSLGTMQIGANTIPVPTGSKQFTRQIDLRPSINAIVLVNITFDELTGKIRWYFKGTDPTTGELTGFLPPNTQEVRPYGEGLVSFSVKPKQNLASGTEIRNKATIIFDVNPPMDTSEVVNTIDVTSPEITETLPQPDSAIYNIKPEISAKVQDVLSGIDENSIIMKLDNVKVVHQYDAITGKVKYTPAVSLSEGEHNIYLQVKDNLQNTKEISWKFTLIPDTTLPTITDLTPSDNTTVDIPNLVISATVSDDLSGIDKNTIVLSIDNVKVSHSCNEVEGIISYTPNLPGLLYGLHKISLLVSDNGANTATITWSFNISELGAIRGQIEAVKILQEEIKNSQVKKAKFYTSYLDVVLLILEKGENDIENNKTKQAIIKIKVGTILLNILKECIAKDKTIEKQQKEKWVKEIEKIQEQLNTIISALQNKNKIYIQESEVKKELNQEIENITDTEVKEYLREKLEEKGDNINLEKDLNLMRVFTYPNPYCGNQASKTPSSKLKYTSEGITFRYKASGNIQKVTIEIYNIKGKLIDKFYDYTIDGEANYDYVDKLANGIYIYRITVSDGKISKSKKGKIVILK